ncbi:MAG: hypothetical protein KIH64_015020 [Mycobacterium sp.]|nr:hypothetical protein [Mycobacterium sp.]
MTSKHTPGLPVIAYTIKDINGVVHAVELPGDDGMASDGCLGDYWGGNAALVYERDALALLDEAGTVAHETGMTPRQLRKRGDDAVEQAASISTACAAEIANLRAQRAQLLEALQPFGSLPSFYDLPDDTILFSTSGAHITAGDVRAARAAVAAATGGVANATDEYQHGGTLQWPSAEGGQ